MTRSPAPRGVTADAPSGGERDKSKRQAQEFHGGNCGAGGGGRKENSGARSCTSLISKAQPCRAKRSATSRSLTAAHPCQTVHPAKPAPREAAQHLPPMAAVAQERMAGNTFRPQDLMLECAPPPQESQPAPHPPAASPAMRKPPAQRGRRVLKSAAPAPAMSLRVPRIPPHRPPARRPACFAARETTAADRVHRSAFPRRLLGVHPS